MNLTTTLQSKIILVFILFSSSFAFSQDETNEAKKDSVPYVTLYDLFKKKENRDKEEEDSKSNFIILPTIGLQPASGFTGGFISQYSFKKNETDRISLIAGGASYSTKKQILTYVKNNMYLQENKYFFSGDYRYYVFSQSNFGLSTDIIPYGDDFDNFSIDDLEQPMKYNYFKFHQTASIRVLPSVYVGAGNHIDDYSKINDEFFKDNNQQSSFHYDYSHK